MFTTRSLIECRPFLQPSFNHIPCKEGGHILPPVKCFSLPFPNRLAKDRNSLWLCLEFKYLWVLSRVVLDSLFRTDSTLTHMTIHMTQLRLNSNPKFANLTQLRLNSKPKFTNLTQLWLNWFESELSQIWLTTHLILPNLGKTCWPGGGGGAVECNYRLVLSL